MMRIWYLSIAVMMLGLIGLGMFRDSIAFAAQKTRAQVTRQRICASNDSLRDAYQILKRKNHLSRGLLKNQREYVADVSKIAADAHRGKIRSEALFFTSSALLPFPTIFKVGEVYMGKIGGGMAILAAIRTVNDRVVIGEKQKLSFDPDVEPLDSGDAFYVAEDIRKRVLERMEFFDQQHAELADNYSKALAQFPTGIWGRVRNGLTLGADDDDFLQVQLAEARYREALYEIEISYTERGMAGLRDACAWSDEGSRLERKDMMHLSPIL